jgi:hypothetical protein
MIDLTLLARNNLVNVSPDELDFGYEYPNNKPYPYPTVNRPYDTGVKRIFVKNDSQRFVPPQNIDIESKTFFTIREKFIKSEESPNGLYEIGFVEFNNG